MYYFFSIQMTSARWVSFCYFLVIVLTACEDNSLEPVSIQFTNSTITVSEAGGEQVLNLTLESAAPADATLELIVKNTNVVYGDAYTTNPDASNGRIVITISEGQTSAQLKFFPMDNPLLATQARTVEFLIGTITGPLKTSFVTSLIVTIADDEVPSSTSFAIATSSTAEGNASGLDISLLLSAPAPGTGQIIVDVTSSTAAYGANFTTEPAVINGKITLPVVATDVTKSIKVLPINNADVNMARTVNFTIESASGSVQKGTNLTHTFILNDDEIPSFASFAVSTGEMSESIVGGVEVIINFSPATTAAGSLTLAITSNNALYGSHFSTFPGAIGGLMRLNVESSATSASFYILPLSDTEVNENRVITFSMVSSTGVVTFESGSTSSVYTHTIIDNDGGTTIVKESINY